MQIRTTVSPVTSALLSSERPNCASVQAREKLTHCRALGRASGLATISALVFNALMTINASGNKAIDGADRQHDIGERDRAASEGLIHQAPSLCCIRT